MSRSRISFGSSGIQNFSPFSLSVPGDDVNSRSASEGTSATQPTSPSIAPPSENSYIANPEWKSMQACIDTLLDADDHDGIKPFLLVFSLSSNFTTVLEIMTEIYSGSILSDDSDLRFKVPILASEFKEHLWLSDAQSKALSSATRYIPGKSGFKAAWGESIYRNIVETVDAKDKVTINDPIASLVDKEDALRGLAKEIALALASLEDARRRLDPIGECLRWYARSRARDFLSFPEMVENWVIQTILQKQPSQTVRLRFRLFYKVAKRSYDISNFSAVRAITSALKRLEKIRIETQVETTELTNMTGLHNRIIEARARKAQDQRKPCLRPLDIILSKTTFQIDSIVNASGEIHWDNFETRLRRMEGLGPEMTSRVEYGIGKKGMNNFVKKCLLNVEIVDDVEEEADRTVNHWMELQQVPGPLL